MTRAIENCKLKVVSIAKNATYIYLTYLLSINCIFLPYLLFANLIKKVPFILMGLSEIISTPSFLISLFFPLALFFLIFFIQFFLLSHWFEKVQGVTKNLSRRYSLVVFLIFLFFVFLNAFVFDFVFFADCLNFSFLSEAIFTLILASIIFLIFAYVNLKKLEEKAFFNFLLLLFISTSLSSALIFFIIFSPFSLERVPKVFAEPELIVLSFYAYSGTLFSSFISSWVSAIVLFLWQRLKKDLAG